jgi:hypothetical protein
VHWKSRPGCMQASQAAITFSEDPHQNLKKIPKHVVTSHSTHPIRNYLYLIHSEPQSGLASYPTLSPG